MSATVLEIENLDKSFGNIQALKDINLSMQVGEFLAGRCALAAKP